MNANNSMFKNWPSNKLQSALTIIAVAAATVALFLILRNGRILGLLMQGMLHFIMAGIAVASYYGGKRAANMRMKPLATYAWVYLTACLFASFIWMGHGDEDDRKPTKRESSESAGMLFFGILPAALLGAYIGNKDSARQQSEELRYPGE